MEHSASSHDHRELGRLLDLFSFHDIAPGAPFWHHNGMIVFRELEKAAREINDREGYQEISTPILVKDEVFKKSGHWEHFRDNMFWFQNPRDEQEVLVLKPMNCPESTYIYNSSVRSYRDLPLRLAEIGRLHRNELSGTLGGLFRVRQITMDDAHIYARPDQVEDEVMSILATIERFYSLFNITPRYVFATRPKKALGTAKEWARAEAALEGALKKSNANYTIDGGEGAFYGPKIEVHMNDSQGRDWQMGTAQLDLVMLPKQFNISYVDENGEKQKPWVIHRAIFGSFERFIGVLLEDLDGKLPLWLAPIQVSVLPVSENYQPYAESVYADLRSAGIRATLRNSGETVSKRVREEKIRRMPYIVVVGAAEEGNKSVTVRHYRKKEQEQIPLSAFIVQVVAEIRNRSF